MLECAAEVKRTELMRFLPKSGFLVPKCRVRQCYTGHVREAGPADYFCINDGRTSVSIVAFHTLMLPFQLVEISD